MTEYIWINEGGETCCRKHGGVTLAAAVDAQEWTRIKGAKDAVEMITTRNHWIGWPVGTLLDDPFTGELEEIVCEYCSKEAA